LSGWDALDVEQISDCSLVVGNFDWTWVLSVALWTAGFAIAAMLLFRRNARPA
jgi:hypothetical protein